MLAKQITSIEDLIATLGGPKAAADVLGTTPQNVVNWRAAKRVPARLYLAHKQKLAARNVKAPDHLWGFTEAAA